MNGNNFALKDSRDSGAKEFSKEKKIRNVELGKDNFDNGVSENGCNKTFLGSFYRWDKAICRFDDWICGREKKNDEFTVQKENTCAYTP